MTWLLLVASLASAGEPSRLTYEEGFVGPFSLHPSKPLLAVVRETGPCYGGGTASSRVEVYELPGLTKPVSAFDVPFGGCTGSLQWGAGDRLLLTSQVEKGQSELRVYARDGSLIKDLGRRRWGAVHLSQDGDHLASIGTRTDEDGHAYWTVRLYRTSDWSFDGRTNLSIDEAKRPPSVVDHGFGMMTWADDRLWIYDLADGTLKDSRPAPAHADVLLQLLDAAAPGGERLVYVANDYQSGFSKPFPKVEDKPLAKHVLTVPGFQSWCEVSGDGIDKMRDWQKASLGSRASLRPGEDPPALYQRSVAWDTLVAFLMPPVDQFRNPFGAGQTAFVIRTTGATCTATKVAELGRDPLWFDATVQWLVVTDDRHAKGPWYRTLAAHRLP